MTRTEAVGAARCQESRPDVFARPQSHLQARYQHYATQQTNFWLYQQQTLSKAIDIPGGPHKGGPPLSVPRDFNSFK